MSSTNVRSDNSGNPCVTGGYMTPEEGRVGMPPEYADKGPSRLEVKIGEGIEIPAIASVLHKDGKLIAVVGGKEVARFSKEAFIQYVNNNRKRRAAKKAEKTGENR